MSYSKERDEFISRATQEGLGLDTCLKLLRYATTLQRLAEAQCNGDYPYNGDRDRPSADERTVPNGLYNRREKWDARYTTCPKCEASGVAKSAMRLSASEHDNKCRECSEVGRSTGSMTGLVHANGPTQHTFKPTPVNVCPDCRTQELVYALLAEENKERECGMIGDCPCKDQIKPIFQGDPRGAVLRLQTPGYPWSDDGSKGYGLYVPARVR